MTVARAEAAIYYVYHALTTVDRYIRRDDCMTMVKEKIINAVNVMSDNEAEVVWNLILKKFPSPSWDGIKEELPDEIDLQMLKEIETDPECHEFTKESDINWD